MLEVGECGVNIAVIRSLRLGQSAAQESHHQRGGADVAALRQVEDDAGDGRALRAEHPGEEVELAADVGEGGAPAGAAGLSLVAPAAHGAGRDADRGGGFLDGRALVEQGERLVLELSHLALGSAGHGYLRWELAAWECEVGALRSPEAGDSAYLQTLPAVLYHTVSRALGKKPGIS